MNVDVFWLKDDVLEESANLPAPDVIAADVTSDMEAAPDQSAAIPGPEFEIEVDRSVPCPH